MTPERIVRFFQIFCILMLLMLVYTVSLIHPGEWSIGILGQCLVVLFAIECARAGFKLQRMILRVRSDSLLRNSESTPISRWIGGNVLRLAMGLSVSWGGVFIHFLRGSVILVYLLYASSLLLLLTLRPGTCPELTEP